MAERDWLAIASEYIEGEDSLRALAKKHAIPWSTLRDRARREAWESFRRDARAADADPLPGGGSAAHDNGAERIFRVTDKLVRRAEEILDGGGELGARELGELMRARSLEEKNEPPKRESLHIEFSPEAEEASV